MVKRKKIAKKAVKKNIKDIKFDFIPKDLEILKLVATRTFGTYADKYKDYFKSLKEQYDDADMDMMFRTYVSQIFLYTALAFALTFLIVLPFFFYFKVRILYVILGLFIFPSLSAIAIFLYTYSYPIVKTSRRKTSIETNLPFAINHMAAVAASGATPFSMFKVLAKFKEYGEVSEEARRVVRDIEIFGLSEISALKDIIAKSPSQDFKNFLEGMLTTIQTGGSMKKYLQEEAKEAMLNYRTSREKYTQMISIYADFYTALLIAAPLILIAILAILNTIGGSVFGLPIDFLMKMGVYILIPILNVLFIIFLQMTQPSA